VVRFSSRSMRAYAALWKPYNDIDIFVEDSSLRGLYERMFNRLLGGRAKVGSIVPLANRDAVVSEAIRLKDDNTRKRLFLVDGDFNWSVGRRSRVRNLYTLPCYSIENFAWDIGPIHLAAHDAAPQMQNSQVEDLLKQQELDSIASKLGPLFIAYAICYRLGATCETVKYSVVRLIQPNSRSALCPVKIRNRIRQVFRHLRGEFGLLAITRERGRVEKMLIARKVEPARFVSGKDHLLAMLMFIFQERFGFKGNSRQLLALILGKPTSLETSLRRAIKKAAK
jgi:hypothetical protein